MIALLCIHGLLSSGDDYKYLKNVLNDYYDYIHIPDLPGHGNNNMKFEVDNTLSYVLGEYDKLSVRYDKIDVIGYSMGGVLGAFLSQHRNINRLILLAPALNYISYENYKPSIMKKSKPYLKKIKLSKRISYFISFSKIVSRVNKNINYINCPICIIWGEDDYLVSQKSGFKLLDICRNNIKVYVNLKNHNHYNLLDSIDTKNIIVNFLNK